MCTFTVDPQSLMALGKALAQLGGSMQGMQAPTDPRLLGGQEVEDAVYGFASTWNYGIQLLDKHVDNLAANLEKAAINYAQTDTNVEKAEVRLEQRLSKIASEGR